METTQHTISVRRMAARFGGRRKLVLAALIIIAIAVVGYFALGRQTPEEKAAKELASAVASIGKFMILPEGDEPVLATVTDAPTLIQQQAFFAGAVNGDQLLIYPRNTKAILYSPSRNKIVNVGPIQTGSESGQTSSAAPQASLPKPTNETVLMVEIRNGTGKAGLAAELAQGIGADNKYKITAVGDAHTKDYSKTVIYAKSADDGKIALASNLASAIGATAISELPAGEKGTDSDVLIIVGGK